MPSSPREFMKRKQKWAHVPETTELHQAGVLHSHKRDLDDTAVGEVTQENWPDIAPDEKGLENTNDSPV